MIHNENKPGEELIKELKELKQKYADLQAAYKKSSARNKQSDERNRLSLKEWQSTFDAIEDMVILLKPNHEIIKANKAALEALNQTPDEIAGKKCYHIVHNTDSPILGCPCEEACKEKRSIIKEYFQNGRFYELSAWPVFDENNMIVWFTHVVKDITQRKRAEQALFQQSQMQELLRKIAFDFINVKLEDVEQVINNSLKDVGEFVKADRVYVFDYDWKNNVCNNTCEWCSPGVQPQIAELQGVPLGDITHWVNTHKQGKIMHIPDVFALPENDAVRQILEPQEIKSLITIPIMDGRECAGFLGFDSVKEHHNYTETEKGLLAVLAQMFVNISHRQEAEKERQKLMHAIEQSPVSIFITGLEGNIEYVNPKTLEITGYSEEELIGQNPRIFSSGEKHKSEYQQLWNSIQSGKGWFGSFHNKKKNGDLYWESASISPLLNEKNEITNFVAVKEDITQRKKFVEDLKTEKEKAQAADRLKTAFLNNISHEVRTPLNGILGFGEMLLSPDLTEKDKDLAFGVLQKSSKRLINTITDFMDISLIVSRNVEVNKKLFDVHEVLQTLYEQFIAEANEKGLELRLESGNSKIVQIETDPELLKKILSHLLDNAVKFTKDGEINFGYQLKNKQVEFFVQDNGIGVEQEKMDYLFDFFTQGETGLTRGYEGSGLGLSISKGLIDLLGGEISLKSEKGKGTTVSVTLPWAPKETEHGTPGSVNQSSGGNTVLIAEDDSLNRLYLETILKGAGIPFISVENGQQAVDKCREHPEIGVVLMDLKMPVMDGMKAMQEIKSFNARIPIIAVTAQAMTGDKQKVLDAGFNDYMAKPMNKKLLLEKIMQFNQAHLIK